MSLCAYRLPSGSRWAFYIDRASVLLENTSQEARGTLQIYSERSVKPTCVFKLKLKPSMMCWRPLGLDPPASSRRHTVHFCCLCRTGWGLGEGPCVWYETTEPRADGADPLPAWEHLREGHGGVTVTFSGGHHSSRNGVSKRQLLDFIRGPRDL